MVKYKLTIFLASALSIIEKIFIHHVFVYPFTDRQLFLKAIESEHKILIAVNAEKLLNDAPKLQQIINDNIGYGYGYADGVDTVMALRAKKAFLIKNYYLIQTLNLHTTLILMQ